MINNVYARERLADQPPHPIRHNRFGVELAESPQPDTTTFWHRLTSLMPAMLLSSSNHHSTSMLDSSGTTATAD